MRKHAPVIVALFGVLLLGMNVASAVSAGIQGGNNLTSTTASRCSASTIQTAVNASNLITLGNIPTECGGRSARVTAIDATQSNNVTVTGTLAGTSMTFTGTTVPSPSTVQSTIILVDGWQVSSQWTAPTGVAVAITAVWNQTASTQYCGTINVSTTSTQKVSWQMALDSSALPFNGDLNASHYQFSNKFGFLSNTPINGVFTVVGQANNAKVSSGSPLSFTICNYGAPNPPVSTDPSIVFTITQTTPSPSYYVCKTVTVSVTGTPYYVGWNADINVANLKSNYIPGGGHIAPPSTGQYTTTLLSGDVYRIHGIGYNTSGIRPGNPVSFPVCWGS